ncbi:MAG: hypothetical protein RLZZ450_2740 [Pseudomonadota bacterium]
MFEIEGEWAESYSTVVEMADASDFVFSGEIVDVSRGEVQSGDAKEDIVFQATLKVRPSKFYRGDITQRDVGVQLILPEVTSQAEFENAIDLLARNVPDEPAVFFLRARSNGTFRVVNGYGIWTHTSRAEIDAPLNTFPPSDGPYAAELSRLGAIDAFESVLEM